MDLEKGRILQHIWIYTGEWTPREEGFDNISGFIQANGPRERKGLTKIVKEQYRTEKTQNSRLYASQQKIHVANDEKMCVQPKCLYFCVEVQLNNKDLLLTSRYVFGSDDFN